MRSHLYAHFSEALSGIGTIRAFRETRRVVARNEELIDVNNRAYYPQQAARRCARVYTV
jgi:hypothetical protein